MEYPFVGAGIASVDNLWIECPRSRGEKGRTMKLMSGEVLDQIIGLLRVQDMTPQELLIACKEGYGTDTLVFTKAIVRLEQVGLVRRELTRNKDNSGSTVYRLDRTRT